MSEATGKTWGGRFTGPTNPDVEAYTASIAVDARLWPYDIRASQAHARMLGRQGIIPVEDATQIIEALATVAEDFAAERIVFRQELEDVHTHVEARLAELVGAETAGRLHTARSRNDQVATDLRLYLKDAVAATMTRVRALQAALLELAEGHADAAMPGYTHMQRAQPVLFAHHLLAYVEMLERDAARFRDCRARADDLPLGSGALAGVPYPLDREGVAQELGFARVTANSIDAVSDRDFVVEYHAAAALCGVHLSRLSEELVLWCGGEFAFASPDDGYATGSSIMPQKKNPDVAELARAKSGALIGNLVAALTLLKGLPLAYNRDLQEDKPALFASIDALGATLTVLAGMVATLRIDEGRMRAAAAGGFALATDLADLLVRRGVPFREAHGIVGAVVRHAEETGRGLGDLTLEELRRFSALFDEEALRLDLDTALAARDVPGGTAPKRVRAALQAARQRLSAAQEEG
ncbi:MAG: argininosuccinate lyase [Dehalococcoidia bacterium]|nr:argininosuccinate lyase [Dehalococcoidia bacterium]